ncbi:MAG: aldo/keto reductase, partial [Erysipelotrichaceae bacterium]|nr:aldo/keto reductase [Erysipelotrichaceae bacterium]
MNYRTLGKTGLRVSEVGFGGEWLERHPEEESVKTVQYAHSKGINIIDCWMPDPKSRDIIGKAIREDREGWIVQGHIGSTYQNNQYTRTRDVTQCRIAFEDLLTRLGTDYIDLGMIHYVDKEEDFERAFSGEFLDYVLSLKEKGIIRHIGMSTHNPLMAMKGAETGIVEMVLFSVNPAFDLMPPADLDDLFAMEYEESLSGVDPVRAKMYKVLAEKEIGITCMKPFAGGRLFDEKRSPFGVRMTPVQCIHYCLTKPAVCSVLCGYDTTAQVDEAIAYEDASEEEKNYASVLTEAPKHSFTGGECTYCGHC